MADPQLTGLEGQQRQPGQPEVSEPRSGRPPLTVGSLFAGVGGFDLGFERAGLRTVWFCEQDEFCRGVLARHWPGVPCYPDVRALVGDADVSGQRGRVDGERTGDASPAGEGLEGLPVSVPYVDVLCGGFPCQDISLAGKGAGIGGARSGLWGEFARLIGELGPRYVVVENVPAITSRGLDVVLGDLAACGFDAEWDHIPASAVGAPHRRDRFWLVAYPNSGGEPHGAVDAEAPGDADVAGRGEPALAYPARVPEAGPGSQPGTVWERTGEGGERVGAGDDRVCCVRALDGLAPWCPRCPVADTAGGTGWADGASVPRERVGGVACEAGRRGPRGPGGGSRPPGPEGGWWITEPDVGRVAHGIPHRVDRLRALGNSLVPQIAEWIGRRIVDYETEEHIG